MSRPDEVIRRGIAELSGRVADPAVDSRLLLGHVLEVEPALLLLQPRVDDAQVERFEELIRRRAAGEPLQHITGVAFFRHIEVRVGPGVFVPRPESEVMVGWMIDRLRSVESPRVVELCAGSGALSLSMADEVPDSRLWAVEKDPEALVWASMNLQGSSIVLVAGDMADALHELDGTVDAVLVNPPYVPLSCADLLPQDVKGHDPAQALFGGADGLDAIRTVAEVAARLLRPGGIVACEHDDSHGVAAPTCFTDTGAFEHVEDHRDLTGRPRFTTARRR